MALTLERPYFYIDCGNVQDLVLTPEDWVKCVLHDAQCAEVHEASGAFQVRWRTNIGWHYCPAYANDDGEAWLVAMEHFQQNGQTGSDNAMFEDSESLIAAAEESFSQYCYGEYEPDLVYALLQLKRAWYLEAIQRGEINSYDIPAELN